jgi:lysophospholipase L1-like esterase
MRARLGTLGACAVFLLAMCGCAAASAPHSAVAGHAATATRYYLSLGDSLAQGMQPNASGLTKNTDQGYADQLYASERRRIPGLRLVKLGCGGETTTSFLTGHGNEGDALLLGCRPAGGSQMKAAETFLRAHRRRGEVALVTIDLGANDVAGCVNSTGVETSCVIKGAARISANLPVILRRLKEAAAAGTPMAGMTLYDPFLQLYLNPSTRAEALSSVGYAQNVNQGLAEILRHGAFKVARVDTAFKTYDLSRTGSVAGVAGPVPVDVANLCKLTWMCAAAPRGPNIHANQAGYGTIARTFATVLGRV